MSGLWRKRTDTPEGKYLVKRRDGTIPEWEWFVLGSRDPTAPHGLRAIADAAERFGMDPRYVRDIREMADRWEAAQFASESPLGDPDAPPHRVDDPETVSEMRKGKSA